jgi:catechol 2,3-dioxygenase-like lactoylglutathione lyase family enzyme
VTTTLGVVRCSLGVSDLDAAVDFYSGVWGLEIVSKAADLVYLTARGSSSPWELRLRATDSDRLDLLTYATADDRALMDIVALAEQNEWPVVAGPAPATEPGGGLAARIVDRARHRCRQTRQPPWAGPGRRRAVVVEPRRHQQP